MTERGSSYEKKYLTGDEISAEMLAYTLSDVPDDADSDIENDSDSSIIGIGKTKLCISLPSYSDSEQSANKSDDDNETLDSAVSTCVKTDKTPNLGPFTTNLYYLQNQQKYVTCSKGLKWSDVTVAEMKNFFPIIILMG